jgi:hypothetical protein
MRLLITLSLLFVLNIADAQFKKTNGYAQVSGGILLERPKFGDFFEREGLWNGAVIRNRWFELQFTGGQYFDVEADEVKKGSHAYVGLHLPVLHKYAKGFRPMGMKGHLIQPFFEAGYSSYNLNESSASIQFSPGISFQLPYVLAEFRMNGAYVIKENEIKGYKGLNMFPSLSFQLDGLLELFNPQLVEGGTGILPQYENVWHEYDKYYDSRTGKTYSVGYYKNEITGWNSYTAYANDVKPFFCLSPYMRFSLNSNSRSATKISGLGFGGRWGMLAFDLMAGVGKQQLAGGFLNPAHTTVIDSLEQGYYSEENFLPHSTYSASGMVFHPELRVGVDVFRMVMGLLFPRGYGHDNIQMATRFFRFHAGFSGGYVIPMGNFKLNNPEIEAEFDEYLTSTNSASNYYNDPRKTPAGYNLSAYGSVELGALGFSWMQSFYSSAPLANGRYYMVSYHMPVFRMAKAYKGKDLE